MPSCYHPPSPWLVAPQKQKMPAVSDPLTKKTQALVSRFQRQRPIRGGSLLVTILGDAIAPRGGVIALGSLIELAKPFGLTERLVRTSIGRLANEQWVSSQKSGRSSFYSLTGNGKAPSLKKMRDSLRDELTWLGFGQLTGDVFAHPTHRDDVIHARLAELESSGQLIVIQRAVVTHASDAHLVTTGWDLGELARRYRRFMQMFTRRSVILPSRSRSCCARS